MASPFLLSIYKVVDTPTAHLVEQIDVIPLNILVTTGSAMCMMAWMYSCVET